MCCAALRADRHGYDPFVLEIDMKPFNKMFPRLSMQSSIGQGVSFLNKHLSAKMFSPNQNAEGRWAGVGPGGVALAKSDDAYSPNQEGRGQVGPGGGWFGVEWSSIEGVWGGGGGCRRQGDVHFVQCGGCSGLAQHAALQQSE